MVKKTIPTAATLALLLSACSTPSDADNTACKLFVDADNTLTAAINQWEAAGEPADDVDAIRSASLNLPTKIKEASEMATGDLAVKMRKAADYISAGTEDGDLAYYMQLPDVYEECESLGVKFDAVKADVD